jgi:Ca2+-binding RTX toxin-like protein
MRLRPPLCAAVAALVAAVFPGTASGGTVTSIGGSLAFANSVGERNDVTVTSGPGTIVFTEAGSEPIGGSCSGSGTQQVTCDATGTIALQLQGGNLDDKLANATALPGQLFGGSGSDTLRGGPANEQLDGGAGADDVDGGGGNDVVYGATLQDAAAGTDPDRLAGGPGDDRLFGSGGADTVDGGPGADQLDGAGGADVLQGADGTDSLSGADGDDAVDGGPGDDALTGGPGNDTLSPGAGPPLGDADTISGGADLDTVSYAARMAPVDVSKDGVANDGGMAERDDVELDVERVSGGLASDALRGGPGADVLVGASGDDTLSGGPGADELIGGPGADTVAYADEPGVSVRLQSGTGKTRLPDDRDALQEIENVDGGSLHDTVVGSAAANVLEGEAGEDYLDGLRGRDTFHGGPSADVVVARDGARNEPVSCGPGRDFAVIDPGDRVVKRGRNRCERVDDGSATRPSRGWVYIHPRRHCAGDARLRLPAQHRLVPLRYSILLRSGLRGRPSPSVDAAACTVRLRAPLGRGAIASADVSGGAATVDQLPGRMVTTQLTVKRPACGRASLSAAPIREPRVRVSTRRPHGRFRVRGSFSLGASFGTDWTTIDACGETTTIVRRGRVKVFDRVKRRTVMVGAGHRYVARRGGPSG